MNESEVVVLRVWRSDEIGAPVLYYEEWANAYHTARVLGPFDFEWVFEVERMGQKDRTRVPAGMRMTWEPLL